jgi:hypothetical protein
MPDMKTPMTPEEIRAMREEMLGTFYQIQKLAKQGLAQADELISKTEQGEDEDLMQACQNARNFRHIFERIAVKG